MKYKKIYNILKKGGASITLDYSGWWSAYCPNNYMARNRPLWIVAEVPHLHLRLWITHEFGTLRVTTADTQIRRTFRNQREMAEYLETMLCRNRKEAV